MDELKQQMEEFRRTSSRRISRSLLTEGLDFSQRKVEGVRCGGRP